MDSNLDMRLTDITDLEKFNEIMSKRIPSFDGNNSDQLDFEECE